VTADAPEDVRAAAARLLGRDASYAGADAKILSDCLTVQTPAAVRSAATHALTRMEGRSDVGSLLLAPWPSYGPGARAEVVDAMLTRPNLSLQLLHAIEAGKVGRSDLDAPRRDRLMRSSSKEVRDAAAIVFGDDAVSSNREAVVSKFEAALSFTGDVARGRVVYEQNCATCHRKGPLGHDIGPDLASVVSWKPDALLTAILNPNRQVEPRYQSYTVTIASGESVFGIITGETGTTISVRQLDGKDRVLTRADVKSISGTGRSLMPDGFESAVDKQKLADLIAFLRTADVK
jgi:putative heme-binding domain-containing protein